MLVEAIERRRLYSHTLSGGLLTIDGTAGADAVSLSIDGATLVLLDGSATSRFATRNVSAIRIDLAAGNDYVHMVNEIVLPATINGGERNDNLGAGGGNDSVRGGAGNDTVFGAGGVDTLGGDAGDDLNDGGDFGDLIEDLLGNNIFIGCKGNDTLTAGPGDDIMIGLWEDDLIQAGGGRNIISGGWGDDTLLGGGAVGERGGDVYLNNNHLAASRAVIPDADVVSPSPSVSFAEVDELDSVTAAPAATVIPYDLKGHVGAAAAPVKLAATAHVGALAAQSAAVAPASVSNGVLTIAGTSRADAISATQYGRTLAVTVNDTSVTYDAAAVTAVFIECSGGDDTALLQRYRGGNRCRMPATVIGGNGDDHLVGGSGDDLLSGDLGDDLLFGGAGDDRLFGCRGDDNLAGGRNDLSDGDGADELFGGLGADRAVYAPRTQPLSVDFADDLANDGAAGEGDNVYSDVEDFFGGSGDDTIVGNASANFIAGGGGDDLLEGGGGNDPLCGGEGHDTVNGGEGFDVLLLEDAGQRDDFDAALFRTGFPKSDFVFGDPFTDYSTVNLRVLTSPI